MLQKPRSGSIFDNYGWRGFNKMSWIVAYPAAAISAALFYVSVFACLIPAVRARLLPRLAHPIPPSHTYLLGFDSLRGLAALFVAAAHCWYFAYPVFNDAGSLFPPIKYGHKGVPLFTALSGFLIYRSVLAINTIPGLREYIARRFFRIYPVYLFSIVMGVALGQYSGHPLAASAGGYVVSDLFMFRVFSAPIFANPVTWSLYVETMFYMALPLAVLALGRRSFVVFAALAFMGFWYANFPGREHSIWQYFLVGILASEVASRFPRPVWPTTLGFLVGCVLLGIDFASPKYDWGYAVGFGRGAASGGMTLGLALSSFLILSTLPNLSNVGKALNIYPLRVLGVISYSLFVIHPLFIIVNFPELGLLSTAIRPIAGALTTPAWYLPVIFLPGILFWSVLCFLAVERPGITLGKSLIQWYKSRVAVPGSWSRVPAE